MNKVRMLYAGGLILMIIGGLFGVASMPVNAQMNYSWINTPTAETTINRNSVSSKEANNGYFGCETSTIEVAVSRTIGPDSLKKTTISDVCTKYQPGGSVGSTSSYEYIKFGSVGSYVKSKINGNFQFAGGRALRSELNDAPWATTGLRVYESPVGQMFDVVTYNNELVVKDKPVVGSDEKSWHIMNPRNNSGLSVRTIGMSPNGKWLVIESGDFWRVNLETREIIPFSRPIISYGYGLDPTYKYAISDDGMNVLIYGGSRDDRIAKMYDLTNCKADKFDDKQISEGCVSRDIRPLLGLSSSKGMISAFLSASGDRLMYTVREGELIKEYVSYPQGVVQFGLEYLALGDSFTSGEGDGDGADNYLPGTDGDGASVSSFQTGISDYPYSVEKCHISKRSYPFRIAALSYLSRSRDFKSVACSGADVNDVINVYSGKPRELAYNGHYDSLTILSDDQLVTVKSQSVDRLIPGRAAQTEFVAKYQPKIISIGIVGNDLGFAHKLTACVISSEATCDYATTRRAEIAHEIRNNAFDVLDKTYKKLKQDSPLSHIYAIGYPQMFTASGSCDINVVYLDQDEREYIMSSIQYLNKIIKAAAAKNGVQYIDIEYSLAGKNLCSGIDEPYVNGLTKGNDKWFVIGNESFHPNEKGHESIALKILDAVNYSLLSPQPVVADSSIVPPEPPKYFGSYDHSISKKKIINLRRSIYINQSILQLDTKPTSVQFKPGSSADATIHSEPTYVDTLTVKQDGSISGNVTIPDSVTPGYHELRITGQLASGEKVTIYEPIIVGGSDADYDGDGVIDQSDPCPFVTPSGKDQDTDGIDDACDGVIGPEPQEPVDTEDIEQAPSKNAPSSMEKSTPSSKPESRAIAPVADSSDDNLSWLNNPIINDALTTGNESSGKDNSLSPILKSATDNEPRKTSGTNTDNRWSLGLIALLATALAGYVLKKKYIN